MNTSRIIELAKEQGKTQAYLCQLLGKNRGYLRDVANYDIQMSVDQLRILADSLGTTPEYLNWETDDPTQPNDNAVRIPVLGRVAAGLPMFVEDNIIDWEEIPAALAREGDYFALQIHGKSMEPRMVEGDIVIVKKQECCNCGQLAIVLVNGDEATCKKVDFSNGGIRLVSYNPLFPDQIYSKEAVEQLPIRIVGVVVELRAKF